MMPRALLFLRRTSLLLLTALVTTFFTPAITGQPYALPGPAAPHEDMTHMLMVNYPAGEEGGEGEVTAYLYPLGEDGMPILPEGVPVFSQPDSPRCQTDSAHASPNGLALVLQYNCEDTLFARLLNLAGDEVNDTLLPQGYLLNWSPDGQWVLFRDIEANQVSLVPLLEGEWLPLDLPPQTYSAVFAPDGQTVLYAASEGLGLGSELGVLNLAEGSLTPWRSFPDQVVAHPAWSPDGRYLTYVLLPDTNIPFVLGELWLADPTNGAPLTLLGQVDAGHGYPPVWSPDGNSLIYVHRENPDDIQADIDPLALRSNLYQVDVTSGEVMPVTQFDNSLVYDAVWWPDGRVVFTVDDSVWMWKPGETAVQVSPEGVYRHPAGLSLPVP